MKRLQAYRLLAGVVVMALVSVAAVIGWEMAQPELPPVEEAAVPDASAIQRGAYLARAGNCMACHTERGGQAYAGGRSIDTPFGALYASNLTPDTETGLGRWSEAAFERALFEGVSRDGRLLYPAFPYTHTTRMQASDVRDLWAFLKSLAPIGHQVPAHDLRFPYNQQAALAVWRVLYFEPGRYQADPAHDAEWNRGAYLIQGVAHCGACHSARDSLGGPLTSLGLDGAHMPDGRWLAPSLRSPQEAGVQEWQAQQVAQLLGGGHHASSVAMGPMAEVVFNGTQYLTEGDLNAMASYLRALPVDRPKAPEFATADLRQRQMGEKLYGQHCADCHGDQGQGAESAYPSLRGNRTVLMSEPDNLVQAILSGGFAPATSANPRPYGMPPFRTLLGDDEVAALATFLRQSWGHRANGVAPQEVQALR